MSDLAGLQSAIRQVPGVARASIRWPDPLGPAILRVEFASGADQYAVTETVAGQMVEVGEVDLSTMQVDPPLRDQPGTVRVEFDNFTLERTETSILVVVTLRSGEEHHVGRADADNANGVLHTVAMATAHALTARAALPVYRIARVDHLLNGGVDEQVTVQVRDSDHALLLGAALVRASPLEAVVRATLDAVNRQVIQAARSAA